MGARSDGRALDGGDGRLVQFPQFADEGLNTDAQRFGGRAWVEARLAGLRNRRRAEVHAGTEGVARRADQERTDGGIGPPGAHRVDNPVTHRDGEGMLRLGAIECDPTHPVVSSFDVKVRSHRALPIRREDVDDTHARAATAHVVLEREPVAHLDLPLTGIVAELPPTLRQLRDAGRADRMTFREQTA